MKKKLISLALAFILALSLLPSPAIAADGDFTIEDGVLKKYKLDSTATASFSDVAKGNWFYTAAASSQWHKLINGYEDNTFRGTANISKVEIVAVSSRVLKTEMGYKEPASPATYLSKYSDAIDSWAQSEVALATKENLIVYRTDGTFSGDKNMTRGDAAIIIYRLFQRIW